MPRTKKSPPKEVKKKICPTCKKEKSIATGFYKSSSPLFAIDGCVPICISCVKTSVLNGDGTVNEVKLKRMCQQLDKPFYADDLDAAYLQARAENGYLSDDEIARKGEQIIGFYFKNINTLRQNKDKSFADSEKDGFLHQTNNAEAQRKKEQIASRYAGVLNNPTPKKGISTESEQSVVFQTSSKPNEVKWSKKDKQNMKYAISTVGYDPFEDLGLSEDDRKYCFNILASYCDTDGISEDGHKIQGVIEIATMYAECRKLTELLNLELEKSEGDESKIQKFTSTKSTLLAAISQIAKDNNIASNYNKNSKQGKNSLTSKMKEMEENGFEEIKVNLFDIKTAEAFKQIDEISNENIAKQLTLDSSEYSDIIKEQREMIDEINKQIDELQEENRNLKNQILDLENKKR